MYDKCYNTILINSHFNVILIQRVKWHVACRCSSKDTDIKFLYELQEAIYAQILAKLI